jgi:hypothetical protein
MNIEDTLAPKSEQLDAVELAPGPRTFTVTTVSKTEGDQPLSISLAEFPRVWRPGVTMRRVLGYCWGTDASKWAGRRVRLFYDPEVSFGRDKTGGTRISHLSHIDKTIEVPILLSKGRAGRYTVEPLAAEVVRDWRAEADALTDADALRALWNAAPPDARDYIRVRAQSLTAKEDA